MEVQGGESVYKVRSTGKYFSDNRYNHNYSNHDYNDGNNYIFVIHLLSQVFSSGPLGTSIIQALFGESSKVVVEADWRAYPHFQPPEVFAPFRLMDGMCYINTLESAASAMEMSAIGGKNCALMIKEHLSQVSGAIGKDQSHLLN
jgi:hypothetical protein